MNRVTTPLDPQLRSVDLFFDPDALSAQLGRRVSVSHLRWKPGVSAVARLHDDDGVRWVAMYGREAAAKLDKISRRAEALGLTVGQHPLDDGMLATGPIAVDPRLYRALHSLRPAGPDLTDCGVRVLKYNPFRRLVFARRIDDIGWVVGRVSASRPPLPREALAELQAGGVPILVPLEPGNGLLPGRHVQYLPWYGQGDLLAIGSAEAVEPARNAGEGLACLHGQRPIHEAKDWRPPARRLASLVRDSAALMPENNGRLARVRDALEALLRHPGRAAVIHGDFSADQVLVDGSSIRLIDFEHCTYGAAASDLGSFAAVEALQCGAVSRGSVLSTARTAALLEGYGTGFGRRAVNEGEILAWTAFYLLNRLREPLRACMPDWRQRMSDRLEMIEEILW